MTVGAEGPDGTSLKGAKSLADIAAGDRVTLGYVRSDKGLIAKSINRASSKYSIARSRISSCGP
ncbi:MAG: hypothetical protein ACRDH5_19240 [bacterium]